LSNWIVDRTVFYDLHPGSQTFAAGTASLYKEPEI